MNKVKFEKINYGLLEKNDADQVREFCLKVIKDTYSYDYRSDWHADLDDLSNPEGVYTTSNKGTFFIAKQGNQIVGTIGVRTLETKIELLKKLNNRDYKDGKNIASIWRTYVKKELRGNGVGSQLLTLAEEFIRDHKFKIIYLHTTKLNPVAVKFWTNKDFKVFLEENDTEQTVHMEKILDII